MASNSNRRAYSMTKFCEIYGWTEDNIKLDEAMISHIGHHINNPMIILKTKLDRLPPGPNKNKMLDAANRIIRYVKWLELNAREAK